MKFLLLFFYFGSNAYADPPFYLRGTNTNQSLGGLNGNFIDENTQHRDRLTTTITPQNCPSGQTLIGANYNNGYTYGGSCSSVATSVSTVAFTGSITISTGATLTVYPGASLYLNLASTTTSSVPNSNGSNANFSGCNIAGSTITLTMSQTDRVLVTLATSGTSSVITSIGTFLVVDGVNFTSSTIPISNCTSSGGFANVGFSILTGVLSKGSHTFCLGGHTENTNWQIPASGYFRFTAVEQGTGGL